MNYLSEMLKLPVLDVNGEKLGVVNDLGIATGEVFPHVTSLAFQGLARSAVHDQLAQVRRPRGR